MTKDFDEKSVIGLELCSVLVATNSIRLQFVRYPLSIRGGGDSLIIEIEHGYVVTSPSVKESVLLRDGIARFRERACSILPLIDKVVRAANFLPSGDVELFFSEEECSLKILLGDDGFEGFHFYFE